MWRQLILFKKPVGDGLMVELYILINSRDDFRIEYGSNSIHVLNAPSPAATAALAIGNDIKKMAIERFNVN